MRHKALFAALWVIFVLALSEIGTRAILGLRSGTSFWHPELVVYSFYPELARVASRSIEKGDKQIDVLLLGGSVLNKNYGSIRRVLGERLNYETRRKVEIHSVAMAAHTSRDSYLKYKWLADKRFDLIIFYHGINEARANNVPSTAFDPQYEHFAWYRYVNTISPDRLIRFVALPNVATFFWLKLTEILGIAKVVPTHEPREDWIKYGKEIKTTASFRANLTSIIEIATSRNEPLLLMTFATYVPNDYSKSRFEALRLDFTRHNYPIEMWGAKEHVLAAVSSHNSVIREAAAKNPRVLFVDQDKLMPRRREYFNDICHFTVSGSQRFVDHMMGIALKAVRDTRTNS